MKTDKAESGVDSSKDARKPNHVTPKIAREGFEYRKMTYGSYSLEDIAAALINHLNRTEDELTPRQVKAFYRACGTCSLSQPENEADLKKFFEILNDIYFNALLTGAVKLEGFYSEPDPGSLKWSEVAYCVPCARDMFIRKADPDREQELLRDKCDRSCSIYFRHNDDLKGGYSTRSMNSLIGSLVHEMLHALFSLYVCM